MAKNAHKRKKQPELVRRALIDHAARLAVEQGLAAVTVQAVSDAAGVTKGGFMHHFPSKQALVDAVFTELIEIIDRDIQTRITADSESYGVFTRAYLASVFEASLDAESGPWVSLSMSWLTDPDLRALWAKWFEDRIARHSDTDGDLKLAIVRLAADGLWISDLAGISVGDRKRLHNELLQATRLNAAPD
ncbi:TetR/AcrR family transcriptional regulator [Neorhizobium sp. DAR64872/K0K18]|uniref:TetR/AcrR family transcriptional regulator n=1 Tax=Neorhizobium sp. DAR64872/K0K18 TaxID=3421958 RepID=UPI003D2E34E7